MVGERTYVSIVALKPLEKIKRWVVWCFYSIPVIVTSALNVSPNVRDLCRREAEDEGTTEEYKLVQVGVRANPLVPSAFCGRAFNSRYGRQGNGFNAQRVALHCTLHGLGELTEKNTYRVTYHPERVERVE